MFACAQAVVSLCLLTCVAVLVARTLRRPVMLDMFYHERNQDVFVLGLVRGRGPRITGSWLRLSPRWLCRSGEPVLVHVAGHRPHGVVVGDGRFHGWTHGTTSNTLVGGSLLGGCCRVVPLKRWVCLLLVADTGNMDA